VNGCSAPASVPAIPCYTLAREYLTRKGDLMPSVVWMSAGPWLASARSSDTMQTSALLRTSQHGASKNCECVIYRSNKARYD
jgi:hypothetical protein